MPQYPPPAPSRGILGDLTNETVQIHQTPFPLFEGRAGHKTSVPPPISNPGSATVIACIARTLSSQTILEHHRSFACADSSQTTPQILHLIYISKPAGREKNLGSEAAGSGVESMASCFSYRCSDH